MQELTAILKTALGLMDENLNVLQMVLRALLVYVAMVALVRLGKKRFMGAATAFDVILGIMIGSIASRAVTGNSPFLPTLACVAALVLLHWVFSVIAMQWDAFGSLIKGSPAVLIRDGRVDRVAMRKARLSERDLEQALRKQGVATPGEVIQATLERNGEISVVPVASKPEIVDISVAEGVQTVRVDLR